MAKDHTTLSDAMQQMLNKFRLKEPMARYDIMSTWENIMGKVVAKHTLKIYIKQKCMYVHLDSSVLRNEFEMSKSKIIEMVNEQAKMKLITDVMFL
ncbi:MAG: DUF721 domain-containing protein [Bacteroidota bacterium]|nr:DUF721 domain-containing protein [Bacteroidota bacterium]